MKDLRKAFREGKLVKEPSAIESIVRQYVVVKAQHEALEQEKRHLKDQIEMHIAHTGKKSAEIAGYSLTITDCLRETFSLHRAYDSLTAREVKQFVSPFVTETEYTQLRVTKARGDK